MVHIESTAANDTDPEFAPSPEPGSGLRMQETFCLKAKLFGT